ncbi:MAG: mechanosensitive ion channel [Anaerolineales bacterium]|nr:mechanosensitive ion channel [Anaerolineales bacterium]
MYRIWALSIIKQKNNTLKVPDYHRQFINLTGLLFLLFFIGCMAFPSPALAQSGSDTTPAPEEENGPIQAPNEVNVVPAARDDEISQRLARILESTGWFVNPEVEVKEGIVFLKGQTKKEDYKNWAEELAKNTQDVVAVVNSIELIQPSMWDFQPALTEIKDFWVNLIRAIPLIILSLLILLVTWIIMRISMNAARESLHRHLDNPLLSNVAAYTLGIIILLIGFYVILQVAGLTNAATAVVGGTGLLGLVVGIAFRDITENFLASIFLSLQDPFQTNDLVEIDGILGYVQALTIRVTVLMTLDGTIVQIPNATVYKSNVFNYSSNPNRRTDFIIGIGYDTSVSQAQKIALKVLEDHPNVLKEPEPLVMVDNLGSATVNLHVFFWLDGKQNSLIKVKSSVMNQIKQAFQEAEISMPDDAREVIFPEGIPVQWIKSEQALKRATLPSEPGKPHGIEEKSPESIETELGSEAEEIQEQARRARIPKEGGNLLKQSDSEGE